MSDGLLNEERKAMETAETSGKSPFHKMKGIADKVPSDKIRGVAERLPVDEIAKQAKQVSPDEKDSCIRLWCCLCRLHISCCQCEYVDPEARGGQDLSFCQKMGLSPRPRLSDSAPFRNGPSENYDSPVYTVDTLITPQEEGMPKADKLKLLLKRFPTEDMSKFYSVQPTPDTEGVLNEAGHQAVLSRIPSGENTAYFREKEISEGKGDLLKRVRKLTSVFGDSYVSQQSNLLVNRKLKLQVEGVDHEVVTIFTNDFIRDTKKIDEECTKDSIKSVPLVVDIQGDSSQVDSLFLALIMLVWLFAVSNLLYFSSLIKEQQLTSFSYVIALEMLLVGMCAYMLVSFTNDSSISAMVSQRWNPLSYVTILVIVVFATTVAISLVAGTIPLGKDNTWPVTTVMPISIMTCLLILIFPLPVNKTVFQLGMVPYTSAKRYAHVVKTFESDATFEVYQLVFLDLSASFLHTMHFAAIGAGYLSGLAGLIYYIVHQTCHFQYIIGVSIAYSVVAFIFALIFLLKFGLSDQSVMASEVIFLLCHFMSLICILYTEDGLFKAFNTCHT